MMTIMLARSSRARSSGQRRARVASPRRALVRALARGAALGSLLGLGLTAATVTLQRAAGATRPGGRPPARPAARAPAAKVRQQTPLLRAGAAYVAGAAASGTVLYVAWLRVRRARHAALTGMGASLPLLLGIRIALHGFTGWTLGDWLGLALRVSAFGLAFGVLWRIDALADPAAPRPVLPRGRP